MKIRVKYAAFNYSDAVFSPEEIVGGLLGYCKKTEIETDGTPDKICSLQIVTDGELVTCKDCKFSIPSKSNIKGLYECTMVFGAAGDMDPDDYCSRGIKRCSSED